METFLWISHATYLGWMCNLGKHRINSCKPSWDNFPQMFGSWNLVLCLFLNCKRWFYKSIERVFQTTSLNIWNVCEKFSPWLFPITDQDSTRQCFGFKRNDTRIILAVYGNTHDDIINWCQIIYEKKKHKYFENKSYVLIKQKNSFSMQKWTFFSKTFFSRGFNAYGKRFFYSYKPFPVLSPN